MFVKIQGVTKLEISNFNVKMVAFMKIVRHQRYVLNSTFKASFKTWA